LDYQGIIFDLDGTLVNTLEDIAESTNTILEANNFPIHEKEAYKYFVGNGLRNLVKAALPEACRQEETVAKCFADMMEVYRKNCLVKSCLYDGVKELLDQLVRRNLKLAILSNKSDELTQVIAKKLLSDWPFAAVLGLRTDFPRKPHPAGALYISENLGISPEHLVYVGDSGVDMETACRAGMLPVGVLWGFRTQEELLAHGAKVLLHHPLDLLEVLTEN